MITTENLKEVLLALGFKGESVLTKSYEVGARIELDFTKKSITYTPLDTNFKEGEYPSEQKPSKGFIIHRNTTTNFKSNENFVCLVAVDKLLEKGYKPEHIILEPSFKVGHNQQVYGDILVLDQEFKNLVLIENKTYGSEFSKEWNNMLKNGGQLFSYYAVNKTPYLCLLAFENENKYEMRLISMQDNLDHLERINSTLKEGDKKRGFNHPANTNATSYFEVWKETYSTASTTKGLFETDIEAYKIGKEKYKISDLSVVSKDQIASIYHEFATILRHYSIGNYENSFYILVDLFLCKVIDEIKNPEDLQFTYKGVIADSPFDYCDRLLNLYEMGVKELFNKEVVNVQKSAIGKLFEKAKRYEGKFKKELDHIFDQQKYFNIKKFNFIEVENAEEFYLNFQVLVQVSGLIQDLYLSESESNQFLGDLFEGFLNRSVHQTEGRFFTPMPLTNFMIASLPKLSSDLKVLDFACGAGHFLTEMGAYHSSAEVYGIEKNKDLSKVAKLACILHNPKSNSHIIFQDALDSIQPQYKKSYEQGSFDLLLSNPPYSVKGFLSTLEESVLDSFSLIKSIEKKSYESNNAIECFFIERADYFLKEGGIFALILPVSILQKSGIYEKTRVFLLEHFKILCIIELNARTFGSTGTQTIILWAQKVTQYGTDLVEKLKKENFSKQALDGDFKERDFLEQYCAFMKYNTEEYRAFLASLHVSETLKQSPVFKEYFSDFESKDPKVFKKKKPTEKDKQEWFKDSSFYKAGYLAFLAKQPDYRKQQKQSQELTQNDEKWFEKSEEYKSRFKSFEQSQDYKNAAQKWHTQIFLEEIKKLELEKMKFFALIKDEEVLILKSPQSDKKQITQFLGYEWSARKGDEGIKYKIKQDNSPSDKKNQEELDQDQQAIKNMQSIKNIDTPLYNPANPEDETKLAFVLAQFMQDCMENKPFKLQDYTAKLEENTCGYTLFKACFREMLDFSKASFNKVISLNPQQERANPFEGCGYELVRLGNMILERPKSKIQVNQAKENKEGKYPFYTSGLNVYRYDKALIEGENIYLSTGGNAVVQFYKGKSAYSTDTFVITSNDPLVALTKFIFYVLETQIDYINTHFFKGSGLKHLQKEDFRNLKIPLPSLSIQEQIVAECSAIEERYKAVRMSIEEYKKLIQAILIKCGIVRGGGGE
ncbi:N-6 DNA methylase [Helicobacter suis]|uniref:N-6 DNA methylase n=1 Tax=Helicobacter suis TaxID=104628 RepID=UPI0013D33AF0|nr:N-6 DNA methylase [Helicobacter suis]